MDKQEFYLIPKSYFDSRKENIQLEILHCQEHQNHVDEEKAIIELATIYEAIGNANLVDLSDEAIKEKYPLSTNFNKTYTEYEKVSSVRNALKDLKQNTK